MSGIVSSIRNLFQKNADAEQAEVKAAEVEQDTAQVEEAQPEGKHGDPGVCCGGCS